MNLQKLGIINKQGITKIDYKNIYFDSVYENKEYHENGKISYMETWAKISDMFIDLFPNAIINEGGYWVRIKEQFKYYDNGQLAWRLKYNDKGEVVKTNEHSYRKDGTIIEY
jgi:hypothetical protein